MKILKEKHIYSIYFKNIIFKYKKFAMKWCNENIFYKSYACKVICQSVNNFAKVLQPKIFQVR